MHNAVNKSKQSLPLKDVALTKRKEQVCAFTNLKLTMNGNFPKATVYKGVPIRLRKIKQRRKSFEQGENGRKGNYDSVLLFGRQCINNQGHHAMAYFIVNGTVEAQNILRKLVHCKPHTPNKHLNSETH